MGHQRRVSGDDNDNRAFLSLSERALRDLLADRDARDAQLLAPAEVRLHQDSDRVRALLLGQLAGSSPDAALELKARHPGPAADIALGDLPALRPIERLE